jgi:predicted N-acyltransferase
MEQINYISIWNKFFREGRSCFGCVQTIPFVFFSFLKKLEQINCIPMKNYMEIWNKCFLYVWNEQAFVWNILY